jgi:ABC-2 type transport system ATP-binding protein
MPDSVVTLENVTVTYGKNAALRDVSAAFGSGAVGLLGPNGAGKSTMLKALLGFLKPDRGRMHVLGLDVAQKPLEIRARLGYMPETDAHIPGMNAVTFVAYCGQLAGLPFSDAMQRAHEVLYYVGLGEARYRNLETYSTGMKQRIKLAQALVHDPDLLFLDEPTNGMDPKGRDEMLELIRDLGHNKRVNLILSSHLLPDVEFTCDRVVVMDKGNVVAQGPIGELKGPGGRVFEVRVKGALDVFVAALKESGMDVHATDEDVMRVFVPADRPDARAADQQAIFAIAARQGVQVRHLRPSVPTLEDAFARAVGED